MMFNEVPFEDPFDAAARAGFSAVEFLFPYALPPEAVAERVRRNGSTVALFNLPPGNWEAGDRGLAALPSRNEPDGEELNFPYLFAELDRLGYPGFVGCGYNPRGHTEDGLGWFAPYRTAERTS